jgi:acyl-CoA thioesterase-1
VIRLLRVLPFLLGATLLAAPPERVIVAIGDSMTAGYGVPGGASYPAQLEMELKKRGYAYRVVNQGVTASTTTQAMGRLTRALAEQPDIVIIQLGGNDASQGIPPNISRDTVRRMIQRFKPGGAKVFLAGGRVAYLDELARDEKIEVIPFLDGVAGHRDLLLSDGVHPNAEGYKVVVTNVLKVLEPHITDKKK